MNILSLVGVALAPCIYFAIIIYGKDKIQPEPKKILLFAFILGASCYLPAQYIEKQWAVIFNFIQSVPLQTIVTSFLLIALTEESLKFLIVRYYAYKQKAFNQPFDGIVCTVFVSLGFATVENLCKVIHIAPGTDVVDLSNRVSGDLYTGVYRMFTAIPIHFSCAVIMGYYIGKAKFKRRHRYRTLNLIRGLVLAFLMHGIYDSCQKLLESNPTHPAYILPFPIPLPSGPFIVSIVSIGIVLLGLFISKRAIEQLESKSVFRFKRKSNIK